ncbi:ferritin-like domain-containing protein [Arundinibacter roseus]|uniref:PA2169 family four-helix-bundle protein n=1 Tax=Arundinibacter roseus TaxID=2070510 RepID=A0A4R4KEJ6_9BACT|nr:PA2169 family four-helix-bundle protein [Arundinibacter roseus]TDB65196.1 PA2169 family four-helix-bundle protein [Arundinibacter roseus]
MKNTMEKAQSVLKRLIKLHYDRIEGYERAKDDTTDADLLALFSFYAQQSRQFRADLNAEIVKYGGELPSDNTFLGDIHKAWMDLKAAVTGKDRETVLSSCEFGEQTIVGSYEDALKFDDDDVRIPDALYAVLTNQLEELRAAKNRIAVLHAHAD